MSDYTKSTNFASKDSLSVGNPLKIVKGTEIDTEFNNIATAVATKADIASPTFTGTPAAPTASAGTNTTQLATTAFVIAERTATATLTNKTLTSPSLSSPTLTGTPVAPTASVDTNTTQVATTAFVVAQIADDAPTKTGTGASGSWGIDITGNAATATKLSTASGSAPSYSARAWVNFDGTKDTTGAASTANTNRLIRASGNVSSVLRTAAGQYTVNFTTAFPDANYAASVSVSTSNHGSGAFVRSASFGGVPVTQTASALDVGFSSDSGSFIDPTNMYVTVFR
jgi:hypothetical protein